MSETLTVETERLPERVSLTLHIEHPERPGTAWCGADVLGIRRRGGKVDCTDCADLRAMSRRRS